ncbi:MAG TPA: hypothetical protein VL137_16895 [Polyangiaceae bacterium]|nr:hypothetical protein [Polyangiaceae bacterium]
MAQRFDSGTAADDIMGWLRDLMTAATPPVRSFDALATGVLNHPQWPKGSRLKQRSLSALLSKIDRGIELDWLIDRIEVQHIVADLLGCALTSVQQGLGQQIVAAAEQARRVRFDDARFAKPLDLTSESLPPGLPLRAQRPASWKHLWWHAPAGSGRSLLGRWLQARGLARFEIVQDGSTAQRLLQDAGEPLFIEITGTVEADLALQPLPELSCCIASDALPTGDHWEIQRSPTASEYLPELSRWLGQRLPLDGNFDPQRAVQWLQQAAPPAWLDRFAVSLGLLGLIDEFGVEKLTGKSLENVAFAYVTEKLRAALEQGNREAQWLQNNGFEALVGLTQRALLETGVPWGTARSEAEWVALVPPEFQQSVDAQWVKGVLSKSVSSAAAKEVERALGKLQPGAFRIVHALQSAAILRAENNGALSLAPHWLAQVLQESAWAKIAAGSVLEWGEALLQPPTAARMIATLTERFANEDWDAIEEVIELDAVSNPAYVAVIEACFRAAGLFLLQGGQLPSELLHSLYEEQRDLAVQIGEHALPRPRIGFPQTVTGTELLHSGFFHLAAWAVSAELPEHGAARSPVLHPFAERKVDPRLPQVLVSIERALQSVTEQESRLKLQTVTCSLLGKLTEHFNTSIGADGEPHPLEWPALVVRELQQGGLTEHWFARLCRTPYLLPSVRTLCEQHKIDWAQAAQQLWQQWRHEREEYGLQLVCNNASALWPFAPADVLLDALLVVPATERSAAYRVLTEAQWIQLQTELPQAGAALLMDTALWEIAPLELALTWLEIPAAAPQLDRIMPQLWQRDLAKSLGKFEVFLRDFNVSAQRNMVEHWLRLWPMAHSAVLVGKLRVAVLKTGAPLALVDAAREFLHRQISSRVTGWREGYELLNELERRVQRFSGT